MRSQIPADATNNQIMRGNGRNQRRFQNDWHRRTPVNKTNENNGGNMFTSGPHLYSEGATAAATTTLTNRRGGYRQRHRYSTGRRGGCFVSDRRRMDYSGYMTSNAPPPNTSNNRHFQRTNQYSHVTAAAASSNDHGVNGSSDNHSNHVHHHAQHHHHHHRSHYRYGGGGGGGMMGVERNDDCHLLAGSTASNPRNSVRREGQLSQKQVEKLVEILNREVSIPLLFNANAMSPNCATFRLIEFLKMLSKELKDYHTDIRVNGGAASFILNSNGAQHDDYNDIDLIINGVPLAFANDSTRPDCKDTWTKVKEAVLNVLFDLAQCPCKWSHDLKYLPCLDNLIKIQNDDSWALISLAPLKPKRSGEHVPKIELKFVEKMKRSFQFSVDSFQILLNSNLIERICKRETFVNDTTVVSKR